MYTSPLSLKCTRLPLQYDVVAVIVVCVQVETLRHQDNSERMRQTEDQLSRLQAELEGLRERERQAREQERLARQQEQELAQVSGQRQFTCHGCKLDSIPPISLPEAVCGTVREL